MSVVKFHVEFLSREVPQDERIARLGEWCRRFHQSGLTPEAKDGGRSLGNLSFRLRADSPSFMITASTLSSKGSLTAGDFVVVHRSDPVRGVVAASGIRDPSSESMMHYRIYAEREEIGAIFHGHDAEITAFASLLGLPETAREQRPGTAELLNEVAQVLRRESFIVMKNHGFLSLGPTMDEAGNQALRIKREIGKRRSE